MGIMIYPRQITANGATVMIAFFLHHRSNNIEVFYTVYEIRGSELIFHLSGNKQYYKKPGESDNPDNPPVKIHAQELYGKWTCYQIVENEVVFTDKDEDWESMELIFSATQGKLIIEGETFEASNWYINYDGIFMELKDDEGILAFPIISLDNGILAVGQEGVAVMYFKKS